MHALFLMCCVVHPLSVVSEEKQPSGGRSILAEGELDVGGGGVVDAGRLCFSGCIGMWRLQRGIMGVEGGVRGTHGGFEQMVAVECDH